MRPAPRSPRSRVAPSLFPMYRLAVYNKGMSIRPLQEPAFLILTSLAAGPQHGYGIMADVTKISTGRVRLRAGTLYAALDRLSSAGMLDVDHEEIVDARLRRYYRLTPAGRDRLTAETARLRANAAAAAGRLGLADA